MASSGRPVSSPTFSYGSSGPPCVAMTAFIVSTTRRTLSVSVPSRSQRTARSGGPLAAATARGPGDDRLGDGQGDLFGDSAIASHLANAHEGRELVVERVDVFQPRVDDLEAAVRQRVAFREALEHHLAAPAGRGQHLADRVRGVEKGPPVASSDAATAHKQPPLVDLYDGLERRRALQETRSCSIVECRERSFGVLRVDVKGAVEGLVA